VKRIKQNVSQALDIAAEQLNEISLEDVEIDKSFQHRIYQALNDIAILDEHYTQLPKSGTGGPGVPCTGFWVEGTQELILFAWCQHKSKTIVVPSEEWFLREDITVH